MANGRKIQESLEETWVMEGFYNNFLSDLQDVFIKENACIYVCVWVCDPQTN